jgi:hypothetical protein
VEFPDPRPRRLTPVPPRTEFASRCHGTAFAVRGEYSTGSSSGFGLRLKAGLIGRPAD